MESSEVSSLLERINDLENQVKVLNNEKNDLENIFSTILCPILITSKDTREIVYANPYAQSQYEISEDELIGLPIDTFYTDDMQKHKILNAFKTKGMVRNLELHYKTYNNNTFAGLLSLMDIKFRGQDCFIGIVSDITSQQEKYNQLKEINDITNDTTMYDELTGLNNKKSFFEKGELLFKVHKIEKLPMLMMVLNIDKLCDINEFFGEDVGDLIIKMFTDKLQTIVREHDLIARYNQNDFVIMLPNMENKNATFLAENIIDKISTITYLTDIGDKIRIYVSIGITSLKDDSSIDDVYIRAKEAVCQAKSKGKAKILEL